jgi:hypothetical protein
MNLDRTERRVVAEKLGDQGTLLAHVIHEVYRCNHVHKEGLTPKEVEHVEKTYDLLGECLNRLRTIKNRARQ